MRFTLPSPSGSAALAALLLCTSLAAASPASAQDDVGRYWSRVASIQRPAMLPAAGAPETVPAAIADALRALRTWELTGHDDVARRATRRLERVPVADEHRAWHRLALAMLLARGPDSRMRAGADVPLVYFTDPHSLASKRSLRLLREALELRPDLEPAAVELALWSWERQDTAAAREAHRHLAGMPRSPDVLMARWRTSMLLGIPGEAARSATAALDAGADRSVASHAAAAALLLDDTGRAAGVAAYFDGARPLTDAGAHTYFRALEPLASEGDAASWRDAADGERGRWLERFWARRAAEAGVTTEERLAEHYRRLDQARRLYPNESPLRLLQIQAPYVVADDSRRYGLSLRGLMLVRHGDPLRLAHLEECLSRATSSIGASGTGIICPGPPEQRAWLLRDGRERTGGETYRPFDEPLDFVYQLYAFRGERTTEVAFAVGVPLDSLRPLERDDTVRAMLSGILLEPDSGAVARVDTLLSAAVPEPTVATGMLLLPPVRVAAPRRGTLDYRVTLSDDARRRGGVGAGRMELPDLSEPGLALSDVVLAPTDAAGTFRRGDVRLALAPRRVYQPAESFRLYYEVYGLPEGTRYRTRISIEPRPGGVGERVKGWLGMGAPSIRLDLTGSAGAVHPVLGLQELRDVRADSLEPGVYTLRVEITDLSTGDTATRSATLVLEE